MLCDNLCYAGLAVFIDVTCFVTIYDMLVWLCSLM